MTFHANDPRLTAGLALLEANLDAWRRDGDIPGLAAAVVHDGDVLWAKGLGLADIKSDRPMEPDTPIRVGSITKVFTTTMMMQLRDAGRLQLDDPVEKHIPGFTIPSPFPGARPITLRQLASHTAGLPVEAPLDHFRTMEFPSGAEMAASLSRSELGFMPSTEAHYSNAGMAVLGHALERAAGVPYIAFVTESILRPLGMSSSGFDASQAGVPLATLYRPRRGDRRQTEMFHPEIGGLVPSGHLYSTVLDIYRFISLQFSEGTAEENGVLAGGSIKEMHAPVYVAPDWRTGFGLGWHLIRLGTHTAIFKSGLTFGSTTDAAFIPALKLGIAVFVNGIAPAPTMTRMGLKLLAPIVEELSRPPAPADTAEQPRDWSMYEGTYAWPLMQLAIDVKIADGRLTVATDTGVGIDTAVLAPLDGHRFQIEGSSAAGDTATFELDEIGRARRLNFGPYSFEREELTT